MVKPQFVREIRDGSRLVKKIETEVLKERICSENTINEAQKLLKLVVEEGTGRNLKNNQFKIAGKTGTTQLAYGSSGYGGNSGVRHQASFCGYFPADKPKYSCIVVVAAPTKSIYGNVVSGTVFKEIADKVYATDIEMARNKSTLEKKNQPASKNGYADDLNKVFKKLGVLASVINPDAKWVATTAQEKKIKTKKLNQGATPNVVGMGLKDAVYLLENKGYLVKIKGSGFVKEQKLIKGRDKVIAITLS
jgi:cell division protein FtsI (penicillin-binding protein 3)